MLLINVLHTPFMPKRANTSKGSGNAVRPRGLIFEKIIKNHLETHCLLLGAFHEKKDSCLVLKHFCLIPSLFLF